MDLLAPDEVARASRSLWDYLSLHDDLRKVDVIVGLGSYDVRVADRCTELFHLGYAPTVLFTGLAGYRTRELFSKPEAAVFADRAQAAGVPASALLLEERATNTGENIRFARDMLGSAASAVFVTKPHVQRRCRATVGHHWPDVRFWVTAPATGLEDQPLGVVTARDVICELVGEMDRLEVYPRLGYQLAVDIPPAVREAAMHLKGAGFTDRLAFGG